MSSVHLLTRLIAPILLIPVAASWAVTADDIRQRLANAEPDSLMVVGEPLRSGAAVVDFYRENDWQRVWTHGPASTVHLTELVNEIRASAEHGFLPEHYHVAALTDPRTDDLSLELLATDAFLTQVRHRALGVVSPTTLDQDWYLPRGDVPAVEVLTGALEENAVAATLAALWPKQADYRALLAKRQALLAATGTEPATVPSGSLLQYGQRGRRVLALKNRLLGPGRHTSVFDDTLLEAVLDFQAAMGLNTDGLVGETTLSMLNADRDFWLDTVDANLERWRWLPDDLPSSYLIINIAAFELRVVDQGWEMMRMRVIVGQPARRTPTFSQTLKYLVYNPIWVVPFEMAAKDKLRELKHDPIRMALQGYEAKRTGTNYFVPVDTIDWRQVSRETFHYELRQLPGPNNALGRIKFMLPNRFAVYLHDTPDQELFDQQQRDFSSGCIRLANPFGLADWVLRHDGQAEAAATMRELLAGGETHTVYLNTPLPVLVVYFTAYADEIGEVMFRRDHYQRDREIVRALRGNGG
ncbi:MAG: murein L,D-transpeptidase [Pseudomonadales bacterium]